MSPPRPFHLNPDDMCLHAATEIQTNMHVCLQEHGRLPEKQGSGPFIYADLHNIADLRHASAGEDSEGFVAAMDGLL